MNLNNDPARQAALTEQQVLDAITAGLKDAGDEVYLSTWNAIGRRVRDLFAQSQLAHPKSDLYLPCPICDGIEGCDHSYPERKSAWARRETQPPSQG